MTPINDGVGTEKGQSPTWAALAKSFSELAPVRAMRQSDVAEDEHWDVENYWRLVDDTGVGARVRTVAVERFKDLATAAAARLELKGWSSWLEHIAGTTLSDAVLGEGDSWSNHEHTVVALTKIQDASLASVYVCQRYALLGSPATSQRPVLTRREIRELIKLTGLRTMESCARATKISKRALENYVSDRSQSMNNDRWGSKMTRLAHYLRLDPDQLPTVHDKK
jgi:hypothetical protein